MSNTVTSEHTRRRNELWSNNRKGPIDICKQTLMIPFSRKPKATHANQHHHRVGETFPYTMIVLVCVCGLRFARKRAQKRLFTNVDRPFSIVAPEIIHLLVGCTYFWVLFSNRVRTELRADPCTALCAE